MADVIIENGTVLTMDPANERILRAGTVVIEDGLIKDISLSTNERADTVIDASGCVVMPGLINTHTHAGMALLRGYADDMPLNQWLEDNIWPVEAQMTDYDIYAGTLLACVEMIKSGTTAFADMYIHVEKVAKAVERSGIRAALSYGMIDFGDPSRADSELEEGKGFVKKWNGGADGRITAMYGPHAPNTCSEEFLIRVREQAEHDNVKVHIHVLETEDELNQMKEHYGMCSVNMLDEIGFLDNNVLAAHCIWLSGGDIEILRERKVNVSHNPVSNMKLGSGIAPVKELIDKGINVSLGTDGCASNNNLDMFEEMKTATLMQKVSKLDPSLVPADTVLKMGTSNGGRALGIKSGILKKGYNADVIIVDMDKPHLTPLYDPISHIVYSARGSDVKTTIVQGQILMDNYELKFLDENTVMGDARKAAADLIERVDSNRV